MALKAPEKLYAEFDAFCAKKGCTDIDRSHINHFSYEDKQNKITVSFMFMRDWNFSDYTEYSRVDIKNKGAVFHFPAYWLCAPKELAQPYFRAIVDEFYNETAAEWISNAANNNNGNGSVGNTGGFLPQPGGCTQCPPCTLPPVANGGQFGGFL